jgi:hypothetical protein
MACDEQLLDAAHGPVGRHPNAAYYATTFSAKILLRSPTRGVAG